MKVAILASDEQKKAWLQKPGSEKAEVEWAGSLRILTASVADVYIDLMFEPDPERIEKWRMRENALVLVNEVTQPASEMGMEFVRINAWPGFLERDILELASSGEGVKRKAVAFFDTLGWAQQWVPDIPGMITPRIIASIINEAYHTLGEGISTKAEIDTAMRLGTNYPMGPFEWSEKIGTGQVYKLLTKMALTDTRYQPAPALENEILMQQVRFGTNELS